MDNSLQSSKFFVSVVTLCDTAVLNTTVDKPTHELPHNTSQQLIPKSHGPS